MAQKNPNKFTSSAEVPQLSEGRMYHIGLAQGEVAPIILLCGDPARVKKVSSLFDEAGEVKTYREYVTVTGKYKGVPVSVMATGIGPDNTEIAIIELSQIVDNPTLIRIGTCGALKAGIKIGDVVISSGALRLENTSTYFVHEGYPASANHEVVLALLASAGDQLISYHLGVTATAPGFYGAQGRKTPHFTPLDQEITTRLETMNVINMEMEASTLFTLSSVAGYRSGAVCGVIAERTANKFTDKEMLLQAEQSAIKTALGAVEMLSKMDKARGKSLHWLPSMGL